MRAALVPCWTAHQCLLRNLYTSALTFLGFKVNPLGEVIGLDALEFIIKTTLVILLVYILLRGLKALVRKFSTMEFLSKFEA